MFKDVLRKSALKYKETFQIGRSHGVHAEPITFGLKNALWSEDIHRCIFRWERALENISVGKISGAVGTYQHLDKWLEAITASPSQSLIDFLKQNDPKLTQSSVLL